MLIPNANTKTNNANTKTKSSKIKFQNEAPVYHTCYTYLPTQDLASINFRKRPACNLFFRR